MPTLKPLEAITARILVIRDKRVLIDTDLAALYGVTTKRLNEQVKRNKARFPADFMFKLTAKEKAEVVANCDHLASLEFSRNRPYVFTEFACIQAASILNSPKAVTTGVHVVRAFVQLRELLRSNEDLEQRFNQLERQVPAKLGAHDRAIVALIKSLRGFVHLKD